MPTVMIDGKKHTPGSNTLKKMKRKAAAEAAAKKGSAPVSKPKDKKKKAAVAKEKAPVPAKKSAMMKAKTGTKLKGKVSDMTNKKSSTAMADAKVRADASREDTLKKSKASAANIGYAKRVTGRKAG